MQHTTLRQQKLEVKQLVVSRLQITACHCFCYADPPTPTPPAERPLTVDTNDSSKTETSRSKTKKQAQSSWNAKHAGADADTKSDFLSNLGEGQDYNINVDHGMQSTIFPCVLVVRYITLLLLRAAACFQHFHYCCQIVYRL